MPSSYTARARFTLQATGENTNLWGVILNQGAFDLIDFAINGVVTISASGATTLTTANGASDQARGAVLNYTGTTAGTLTIPSVEKVYQVRSATADLTITNGSSSLTIPAGDSVTVITNGTAIWKLQANDRGGARLRNLGAPTSNTDAATKKYVDDSAFSGIVNFPALAGNRARGLRVNAAATNAEWEPNEIGVTSNYTATVGDRIVADTTAGTFIVTLPASPAEGDQVWIRDGGNTTTNQGWKANPLTINPNGSTVRGDPDSTTSLNMKGVRVTFFYRAGAWSVTVG